MSGSSSPPALSFAEPPDDWRRWAMVPYADESDATPQGVTASSAGPASSATAAAGVDPTQPAAGIPASSATASTGVESTVPTAGSAAPSVTTAAGVEQTVLAAGSPTSSSSVPSRSQAQSMAAAAADAPHADSSYRDPATVIYEGAAPPTETAARPDPPMTGGVDPPANQRIVSELLDIWNISPEELRWYRSQEQTFAAHSAPPSAGQSSSVTGGVANSILGDNNFQHGATPGHGSVPSNTFGGSAFQSATSFGIAAAPTALGGATGYNTFGGHTFQSTPASGFESGTAPSTFGNNAFGGDTLQSTSAFGSGTAPSTFGNNAFGGDTLQNTSAFGSVHAPSTFGRSPFEGSTFQSIPPYGSVHAPSTFGKSPFGDSAFQSTPPFGYGSVPPPSTFGKSSFGDSAFQSTPPFGYGSVASSSAFGGVPVPSSAGVNGPNTMRLPVNPAGAFGRTADDMPRFGFGSGSSFYPPFASGTSSYPLGVVPYYPGQFGASVATVTDAGGTQKPWSLPSKILQVAGLSTQDGSIWRVDDTTTLPPEACTPLVVFLGPLFETKRLSVEETKLRYAHNLIRRAHQNVNHKLTEYLDAIKVMENQIGQRYDPGEHRANHTELVEMVVLDGLFIIEVLINHWMGKRDQGSSSDLQERKDFTPQKLKWDPNALRLDMIIVQNQIPFFVLEKLFCMVDIPELGEDQNKSTKLKKMILDYLIGDAAAADGSPATCEDAVHHILHLVYLHQAFYSATQTNAHPMNWVLDKLGKMAMDLRALSKRTFSFSSNLRVGWKQWKVIPPLRELVRVGVKLKRAETTRFAQVKFSKGVLEIPPFAWRRYHIRLLTNLVVLEMSGWWPPEKRLFCSYVRFMAELIKNKEDATLLFKKGIVQAINTDDIDNSLVNPFQILADYSHGSKYDCRFDDLVCEMIKCYKAWSKGGCHSA